MEWEICEVCEMSTIIPSKFYEMEIGKDIVNHYFSWYDRFPILTNFRRESFEHFLLIASYDHRETIPWEVYSIPKIVEVIFASPIELLLIMCIEHLIDERDLGRSILAHPEIVMNENFIVIANYLRDNSFLDEDEMNDEMDHIRAFNGLFGQK